MHALALASLRASSLLRMTYQFLKTFASVSTYIAGNHSLHKTLILLALRLIINHGTVHRPPRY